METVSYIENDVGVAKTSESELMSVEEYFDMVWHRYLEKYEKLQTINN